MPMKGIYKCVIQHVDVILENCRVTIVIHNISVQQYNTVQYHSYIIGLATMLRFRFTTL